MWQYDWRRRRVVETYISYLRKTQVDVARGRPLIHTRRGFGYVLRDVVRDGEVDPAPGGRAPGRPPAPRAASQRAAAPLVG